MSLFEDLVGQTKRSADEKGDICPFKITVFEDESGECLGGEAFAMLVEGDQESVLGEVLLQAQGFLLLGEAAGGFVLVVRCRGLFERNDLDLRVRLEPFQILLFGFLEVRLFGFADLENGDAHGAIVA